MWYFSAALCFFFFFQHIGKFYHGLLWKCCIQPLYLFFYVFYKLFPHSSYLDTFSRCQRHLHRQRCCVHVILTVHVCLSFQYMVSCLFSQSSLYSSYPCTAHWLVLNTFKVCMQHTLILSIVNFLPFFFFSGRLDPDVTIAAAVLIVLISCWPSPKTVAAAHAIVICKLSFSV